MIWKFRWFVLSLLLTIGVSRLAVAAPLTDWSSVASHVTPAVVNISVAKIHRDQTEGGIGTRESFSGSGFMVDPEGDIVTNKHVIDGAFRITVMLNDRTELRAQVVAAAAMVDIAVLKVNAGRPLPYLKLDDTGSVAIGDPVLAVGNPLGIGTSVSSGVISGLNRDLRNSPFDDYIQTDAAINHGNSGGPLVDAGGQVIGVNTILLTNMKNEGSNGLGFAISSTVVNYVVHHLEDPSRAPVGWIGTHLQDMTTGLARAFGMPRHLGCIITQIDPDSPALQAGLHEGDVILHYDGKPVSDARAFMRAVATTPIGKSLALQVWQDGREGTVGVVVRAWPHLMEPRGAMLAADVQHPLPSPDFGLLLAPLTDVARKEYGLQGVNGVLVVAVDKQSEAFGQGVAPGEVIEQVVGRPVSAPSQVYHLAQQSVAAHGVVAMLVLWRNGPHWIVLHAGRSEAEHLMSRAQNSPAGATGVAAAPSAHPGNPPRTQH